MTVNNEDFVESIRVEKRLWRQGKQTKGCSFRDLMQIATTTYDNLTSANEWPTTAEKKTEDPNFSALSTQIEELNKSFGINRDSQNTNQKLGIEMTREGMAYYLCGENFHPRKQWYICKVCIDQ